MSEHRYLALLKDASSFFAQAEEIDQSKKQAVILEIQELMSRYGLSFDDLN